MNNTVEARRCAGWILGDNRPKGLINEDVGVAGNSFQRFEPTELWFSDLKRRGQELEMMRQMQMSNGELINVIKTIDERTETTDTKHDWAHLKFVDE